MKQYLDDDADRCDFITVVVCGVECGMGVQRSSPHVERVHRPAGL